MKTSKSMTLWPRAVSLKLDKRKVEHWKTYVRNGYVILIAPKLQVYIDSIHYNLKKRKLANVDWIFKQPSKV